MKIVFIRHGETDKIEVDKRGFIGQGRDLAPLTELGIQQAEKVSLNPMLENAQIIVSSPYTRALQTAAIISRKINKEIIVEPELHEWIVDKTNSIKSSEEVAVLGREFQ